MGGKFLLKLNNGKRPIVNKYREGKMKRTLKRGSKVPEIAIREADKLSGVQWFLGRGESAGPLSHSTGQHEFWPQEKCRRKVANPRAGVIATCMHCGWD